MARISTELAASGLSGTVFGQFAVGGGGAGRVALPPPQAVINRGRASSRAGARNRRWPDETGVMCMISG
jgi:hypothetical protein